MKRFVFPFLILALLVTVFILVFQRPSVSTDSTSSKKQAKGLLFAVVGDTESHATIYRRILEQAKERGAQFVLHTGDVTENGTAEELKAMQGLATENGMTVEATLGNHDIRTDATRALWRKFFAAENRAIAVAGYRFLLLDNAGRKTGFSPATLEWLQDEFAEHPDARYVLSFHRPFNLPLQSFTGDDETPTSRSSNEKFLDLLVNVRVLAIFSGHLHLYLPYSMNDIPVYVSGGGGGEPQTALAGIGEQNNHFLLVRLNGEDLQVEVVRLI